MVQLLHFHHEAGRSSFTELEFHDRICRSATTELIQAVMLCIHLALRALGGVLPLRVSGRIAPAFSDGTHALIVSMSMTASLFAVTAAAWLTVMCQAWQLRHDNHISKIITFEAS